MSRDVSAAATPAAYVAGKAAQVLIVVWLTIAAFASYLVFDVIASRAAVERQLRDHATSYARVVNQHASATFERADIALGAVVDHLLPSDLAGSTRLSGRRRSQIEQRLADHQQRTPGVFSMALVDAQGNVIASSLRTRQEINLGDRDYFQELKRQPRAAPIVSAALHGRLSGMWGIQIARRVDLPDGSFGGMVSAYLGLTRSFADFYATLAMGTGSSASLRDSGNRLLVRYPMAEESLGSKIPFGDLTRHFLAGESEGVMTGISPLDQAERMYAFHRLSGYPIYAVVGLSREEALAGWKHGRDIAAAGAALLVAAGVFITLVLGKMRRAERLLREASRYTRTLIEASLDPLVTIDIGGKITDVNRATEQITGCGREALIGTDFSDYFTEPDEARAGYRKAFEAGRVTDFPLAIRHRDGRVVDVLYNASVYRDENGRVLGVFAAARDVTRRKQAERELKRLNEALAVQALRDPLTGLYNRRYLEESVVRELYEADRGNYPVSFVMIDIDHFKVVNDTHGHQAGDAVLQALSNYLRANIRGGDIACRYGGEEFLLVLPRTPVDMALQRAEEWRSTFEHLRITASDETLRATISAGIAAYPAHGETADAVVSSADRAMYSSKEAGRNRVSVALPVSLKQPPGEHILH